MSCHKLELVITDNHEFTVDMVIALSSVVYNTSAHSPMQNPDDSHIHQRSYLQRDRMDLKNTPTSNDQSGIFHKDGSFRYDEK